MVNYSKEKKRLLTQIRREVFPQYLQLVHAGTLTLSGDDGSVVRIVFAKGNFAHHHGSRAISLEKGLSNSGKKIRVAPVAFDALLSGLSEQQAYIVQSAKSSVAIFVGETGWALGLKLQEGTSNDYIPVSLLEENVLSSLVHRSGSVIVRVTSAEWR